MTYLSEEPEKTKNKFQKQLEKLPIDEKFRLEIVEDIASAAQLLPSHYLSRLIENYGEGELQKIRKSMQIVDDLSSKNIVSAIDVFIDAFDQSLQEAFKGNLGAWRAGQLGLVKAAHTLFTTNHHIKVYATIRQEAWAGFVDPDKQVIRGKSLILEPTDTDLKQLFIEAIRRNTGEKSIEDFLGTKNIYNAYCEVNEDAFRYILRHSSSSPRSLMQFGKALDEAALSSFEGQELIKRIRYIIDDTSSANIFEDYLESQKQMFMSTLSTETRLRVLLKLIPSNVLTAGSLKSINRKFAEKLGLTQEESHPFCELFNSGLIGQVRFDPAAGGYYQYFRKPHEFDWTQQEILEENSLYFLHPGLVSHLAKTNRLHLNRFVVIEPGHEWKIRRGHAGVPTVFISHSTTDKSNLEPFLVLLQDELNLIFPSEFWIDKDRIVPGDLIHAAVENGVSTSDILVLFASKKSLDSGWVEEEWRSKHKREVQDRKTRVIVAIIDDTDPNNLPQFLAEKRASICPLHGATQASAQYLAKAVAAQATKLFDKIDP